MPRKKETPEIKAAREHFRSIEEARNPLPKITAPENTAMWEEQIWAWSVRVNERERAEEAYIERVRQRARQRVIDKLLDESNRFARRQRTIENLWRMGHFKESPDERAANLDATLRAVAKALNEKYGRKKRNR